MAPSTGPPAHTTPGACLRCGDVGWAQAQPLHAAGEVYAGPHPIRVAAHPFTQPQPERPRWPSAPADIVRWKRHSPESPPRQDAAGGPAPPTPSAVGVGRSGSSATVCLPSPPACNLQLGGGIPAEFVRWSTWLHVAWVTQTNPPGLPEGLQLPSGLHLLKAHDDQVLASDAGHPCAQEGRQ
jgi:hypothetical protein